MGITVLKIRRSRGRLLFNMGIPIPLRWHFCIETAPVASFTKEVNLRLAKRSLKINGRLANRWLTLLQGPQDVSNYQDDITGRSVSGVTQPNAAHSRIHVYVPGMVISLEFIGGSVKIGLISLAKNGVVLLAKDDLISLAKDDHVSLAKDAIGCNTFKVNVVGQNYHPSPWGHMSDRAFKITDNPTVCVTACSS